MESHILLPVMKLPGIRFMPCPVQTPPRIRAITPTVIKVSRLKLLLMSLKILGPADLSPGAVPAREVGQNAVSGRLATDYWLFDLCAQQCLDEVREVDDGRRRQDDIAGAHPDRHVTHRGSLLSLRVIIGAWNLRARPRGGRGGGLWQRRTVTVLLSPRRP